VPDSCSDLIDVFNESKASELLKQGGFEYFINITDLPLYSPLYSFSEV